ncbi:MAG: diphthamide biosynthesis enzyme Dph2 [Candidatus Thermoplasmatota archaeon]|nr:diphthamide biosynthesis enzyme Dph2 [Candidatus Thermoplasmatota archaeon]MCL5955273.1 diphthamide biosynthesis enzyme Dph2 [Candidatus Thermoplasmatota archaeon]
MIKNFDDVMDRLQELNAKKVLLQLPDGLKPHVFEYFNRLSEKYTVVVSSDPFYGACDISTPDVYRDVDCIVQLGHSEIPNIKYPKPMIFMEYRVEKNITIEESVFQQLRDRGFRKIGLLCSIQYIDQMQKVGAFMQSIGFEVIVGKQDNRMKYPGQVLGCNFSAAHSISSEVDAYVVVSTGKFHAIGAQLASSKDVFILDMHERRLNEIRPETDKFLRRRYAKLSKARDARKICVVADTKIGQYRIRLANKIVEQAKAQGLEPVLLTANDVRPSDYENMRCDAVVFTGCPRVSLDESDKFPMPILTPPEFQQIFGIKENSHYVMDEIVAVDEIPS